MITVIIRLVLASLQIYLVGATSEPRPRFVLNEAPLTKHQVTVGHANALNNTYWANPSRITVCWEDAGSEDDKERTRNAVRNSWERYSSLRFIGWHSCTSEFTDIRIRTFDGRPYAGVGSPNIRNRTHGMLLNFEFVRFGSGMALASGRDTLIEGIAIHEFGHAIGLLHEQGHPQAHRNCTLVHPPKHYTQRATLTIYDPDSVMNYCNQNVVQNYLSPLDIEAVGIMYPQTTSVTERPTARPRPTTQRTTQRSTEGTTAVTNRPLGDRPPQRPDDHVILILNSVEPRVQGVILRDDRFSAPFTKLFPMIAINDGWPPYDHDGYDMLSVVADGKIFLLAGSANSRADMIHHFLPASSLKHIRETLKGCNWECRFTPAKPPSLNHYRGSIALVHDSENQEFIMVCGAADGHVCEYKAVLSYRTHHTYRLDEAWIRRPVTNEQICLKGHAAATYKGNLMVSGGYCGPNVFDQIAVKTAYKHDFQTNEWTELAPMNKARSNHEMAVDDRFAYVCGSGNGSPFSTSCERFDGRTWSWMKPMTELRSLFNLVAYGNKGELLAMGGWNGVEQLRNIDHYNGTHWRPLTGENQTLYQFGERNSSGDAVLVPSSLIEHWW